MERIKIPVDVRSQVLHEAAYQCSNPMCRTVITLDIHHIDKVANDGSNTPDNLIALCPNCHRRFHSKEIPVSSIRAWKYYQLALNEAFDKKATNYLLLLRKAGALFLSSEGLLEFAGLIASGNVDFEATRQTRAIEIDNFLGKVKPILEDGFVVRLSEKGNMMISGWIDGVQTTGTLSSEGSVKA